MKKVNIGFIGAGGIARSHAYALQAMKYYYQEVPAIELVSVCSAHKETRQSFAEKYGFQVAEPYESILKNDRIDTVFILGPNNTHFDHFRDFLGKKHIRRIYLEKPVCSSEAEEREMARLYAGSGTKVQAGFQFLLSPAIRQALIFWKTGILGNPLHFDLKYYHGDYLKKSYRDKRITRLTPAPDGGAMADLGCHGLSLLTAFLGNGLKMTGAIQAGSFEEVPAGSDLFSSVSLVDPQSRAAGHLSASRISSGSGDLVQLEIFCTNGALRYSSQMPDSFEYYLEEENKWIRHYAGSNYPPLTAFPSGHVSGGWLRALVHAHYLFLGGEDPQAFIPGLEHGLEVQRLVRETAHFLKKFRNI